MKLYTGNGDSGYTQNLKGEIIPKDMPKLGLIGTMDELTSVLGLAKALCSEGQLKDDIDFLQDEILHINKEFSGNLGSTRKVKDIENLIDSYEALNGSFKGFVKPGETKLSAVLDMARTVARRAERLAVAVNKEDFLDKEHLIYLNRLSDLLYAMARYAGIFERVKEMLQKGLDKADVPFQTEIEEVGLKLAKELAVKIEQKANEKSVNAVIAVCDKGGNLVLLHRMDEAFIASIDIAINKAYTSASLKMTTTQVGELSKPGESLYGLQYTNGGRIVIFGGGVPLKSNGIVIGGLGVSGGTAEEDSFLAEYGAAVFEGRL